MSASVVDASVVTKWFLPEEHGESARRLLQSDRELFAPDLLYAELGNALWKYVLRGQLEIEDAREIGRSLPATPLVIQPSSLLLDMALELAIRLRHPVHDCIYLALAIGREAPLVTADRRLFTRVSRSDFADHVCWVGDLN